MVVDSESFFFNKIVTTNPTLEIRVTSSKYLFLVRYASLLEQTIQR